jgi:hypothetical protein
MNVRIVAVLCTLALTGGTTSLAQQGFIPAPSGVRRAEAIRPTTGTTETRIIGSVIDIRQVPVANVHVQLRNLGNGNIDRETDADANGDYEFTVLTPGTYVAELVVADGIVAAVSNAGTVGRFETLQTVIQLPGRWQNSRVVQARPLTDYFGMSSRTSMTAATLRIASDLDIATADPGEPVSP